MVLLSLLKNSIRTIAPLLGLGLGFGLGLELKLGFGGGAIFLEVKCLRIVKNSIITQVGL